jgi:hypothetical protein
MASHTGKALVLVTELNRQNIFQTAKCRSTIETYLCFSCNKERFKFYNEAAAMLSLTCAGYFRRTVLTLKGFCLWMCMKLLEAGIRAGHFCLYRCRKRPFAEFLIAQRGLRLVVMFNPGALML